MSTTLSKIEQMKRKPLLTPRADLQMNTTFIVMQAWWGEIDLQVEFREDTLTFQKYLGKLGTTIEVTFNATDHDGTNVKFTFPIDMFSKLEYTELEFSMVHHPTALILHLNDKGYKEFMKKLPGLVEFWKPKLQAHKRTFSHSLLFVIDPTEFTVSENNVLLYRPRYPEGIINFQVNYNQHWEQHLTNHRLSTGKLEERIVSINEHDFDEYSKVNGLRNIDSQLPGLRNRTIRIFAQRRNINRKNSSKRGVRREGDHNANGEDEEMEVDEISIKEEIMEEEEETVDSPVPEPKTKKNGFVTPKLPKRRRRHV
ncbi:unnamed protein product [Caenorhabditis brenneri]